MRIDVLTLFPEMLEPFFTVSIVGRARRAGVVEIVSTQLRDFASDKHKSVDDKPFGGGPGMVLMCGPMFDAVEHVEALDSRPATRVLLTPQGERLTQRVVRELAAMRSEEHHRGLRTVRRRAGGRGPGGRGGSPAAGGTRRRRGDGIRVVHRKPAGVSAVHKAARVSRHDRAGRAALRGSPENRRVAAATGRSENEHATAGSDGRLNQVCNAGKRVDRNPEIFAASRRER